MHWIHTPSFPPFFMGNLQTTKFGQAAAPVWSMLLDLLIQDISVNFAKFINLPVKGFGPFRQTTSPVICLCPWYVSNLSSLSALDEMQNESAVIFGAQDSIYQHVMFQWRMDRRIVKNVQVSCNDNIKWSNQRKHNASSAAIQEPRVEEAILLRPE